MALTAFYDNPGAEFVSKLCLYGAPPDRLARMQKLMQFSWHESAHMS